MRGWPLLLLALTSGVPVESNLEPCKPIKHVQGIEYAMWAFHTYTNHTPAEVSRVAAYRHYNYPRERLVFTRFDAAGTTVAGYCGQELTDTKVVEFVVRP